MVSDPINEQFDLILCRHTMIHLFINDDFKVFQNFIASNSSYLLMSTQSNSENTEIAPERMDSNRARPLNFFRPPFSFPAPICIGKDTKEELMYAALYELKTIENALDN